MHEEDFILSNFNYSSYFSHDGNDEEEDLLDNLTVTDESKPMANQSNQLSSTCAQEEEECKRKFSEHSSVHPSTSTNFLSTDGYTFEQLCSHELCIAELQAEVLKLRKTVLKLKQEKSQLQENIGLYYGQCDGTSVDDPNSHNVLRVQQTQSGARQQVLDCVHAAHSLVSCIAAINTEN
ncbi:hypothetical protein ACA910_017528 [Epithemia clementina (nom. ined.)]